MNYSKQYIADISNQTGFISYSVEKVIRLLDVLDFIFYKSSFKSALSLKGGTAINLIYTNLNRLSFDIDLDYHRYLDKDKTMQDRNTIIHELDDFMESEGYLISNKSRDSAILSSRTYSYINSAGNNDNIKVEINFIDRISLYPTKGMTISYFDKNVEVICPPKEEIYGMKIAALINRSKPRDLYDIDYLFKNMKDINFVMLRKASVFYLSLDGVFKIEEETFKGIKNITWLSIKKELWPVIKSSEKFNLINTKEFVMKHLIKLLTLDQNEKLYLEELSNGNYNPYLLFDDEIAKRAEKHPMGKRRAQK